MKAYFAAFLGCIFLVFTPVARAQSSNPYLYYFSDILHAFVIERADGTDSRQIGQGIIPKNHNSIANASWSPSGEWFVYTSYRSTNHDDFVPDEQGQIAQTNLFNIDGQTMISMEADAAAFRAWMQWSPVADLLLYVQGRDPVRVRLFDPNRNQFIFETFLDGVLDCYPMDAGRCLPAVWSGDGSQLSLRIVEGDFQHFYNLLLPTFRIEETLSLTPWHFVADQSLVTTLSDNSELIIYNIFSHGEWRYLLENEEDVDTLAVTWDAQQTQAWVEIATYFPEYGTHYRLLWFSLEGDELITLKDTVLPSPRCTYHCVIWSPDGNKAVVHVEEHPFLVFVPTMQQVVIPISSQALVWMNENQLLISQRLPTPEISDTFLFDVHTQQSEALALPARWNPRDYSLSPDQRHLQVGNSIYDVSTLQKVAQSRISGDTLQTFTSWRERSDWVLFEQPNFFPCCGIHSVLYEVIQLNSTMTRELTTCYGAACVAWLPATVEPHLPANGALNSLVPSPSQTIIIDGSIQRLAWINDGVGIQVVSSHGEDQPMSVSFWEVATETEWERYPIPHCSQFSCILSADLESNYVLHDTPTPLTNHANSLQLVFEASTQNYAVQEVRTGAILKVWHKAQLFFVPYFRWAGDMLFIAMGSQTGICIEHWHPTYGSFRSATPLMCRFSQRDDFVLLIPLAATQKTYLLDTLTGGTIPINYYARDGAFSPDGRQIALGSKTELTIWTLADILASYREDLADFMFSRTRFSLPARPFALRS